MITKDQASDLRSLIDHRQRRALEVHAAEMAKKYADGELEAFLCKLQQQEKDRA